MAALFVNITIHRCYLLIEEVTPKFKNTSKRTAKTKALKWRLKLHPKTPA